MKRAHYVTDSLKCSHCGQVFAYRYVAGLTCSASERAEAIVRASVARERHHRIAHNVDHVRRAELVLTENYRGT